MIFRSGLASSSLFAAAVLTGCGGGPNSNSLSDANAVTEALVDRIAVDGAEVTLVAGVPPAPAGDPPMRPIIQLLEAEVVGRPGDRIEVPVIVSIDPAQAIEALFAMVPGAASYFQASLDPEYVQAMEWTSFDGDGKGQKTFLFAVDLPSNFQKGGQFCFDFSAQSTQDTQRMWSDPSRACVAVSSLNAIPTPAPPPVCADSWFDLTISGLAEGDTIDVRWDPGWDGSYTGDLTFGNVSLNGVFHGFCGYPNEFPPRIFALLDTTGYECVVDGAAGLSIMVECAPLAAPR